MAQYVDKDALIAEIVRRRKAIPKEEDDKRLKAVYGNEAFVLTDLLSFIDTLEMKEVDLEKELQNHIRECLDVKFPTTDIELIKKDVEYTARKFFELGLKTQKGE